MKKDVKKLVELQINGENIQIEKKKIKNMYLRISPANWIMDTRKKLEENRAAWAEEELSEEERKRQKELYRKQLAEILPEVIRKCEQITGLHAREWRLRDMKTRWGSCNTVKKRIWLNIQLAACPRECLEYVVTHELVHLLVPGHGKEFWAYMDRFFPDWKRVRKELNGR